MLEALGASTYLEGKPIGCGTMRSETARALAILLRALTCHYHFGRCVSEYLAHKGNISATASRDDLDAYIQSRLQIVPVSYLSPSS